MKNTRHINVKSEPKVLYVPNITTELNDNAACNVSYVIKCTYYMLYLYIAINY